MSTNYWLGKSKINEDLKKLDDVLMDAWSNDATLADLLDNMPPDVKKFFLNMKLGCPDIFRDGIKIVFEAKD